MMKPCTHTRLLIVEKGNAFSSRHTSHVTTTTPVLAGPSGYDTGASGGSAQCTASGSHASAQHTASSSAAGTGAPVAACPALGTPSTQAMSSTSADRGVIHNGAGHTQPDHVSVPTPSVGTQKLSWCLRRMRNTCVPAGGPEIWCTDCIQPTLPCPS